MPVLFLFLHKLQYTLAMIEITPKRVSGKIEIPASKSQTIRAFLIATFSKEKSIIRHPLLSDDTKSCIEACKKIGAEIIFNADNSIAYVDATNACNIASSLSIDCGNSGTTEYLLLGLAASLGTDVTIFGDKQLNSRPVGPLANSLKELGATIETNGGKPPIKLKGPLSGGKTTIECKTSQYLSGLLLATPLAKGNSTIDCSLLYEKPYVAITLSWLEKQGIEYQISEDFEHVKVKGGQRYHGFDEYIAGDFSSASFFFCMAAISGGEVTVKGLNPNDPQGDKAILDILKAMGCEIIWNGNEVTVKGSNNELKGRLKGGEFDLNAIPDALPVLAVTAAFANGDVHLTNVPQARIKETDRIATMCENLRILGVDLEEEEDGILIHAKGKLKGGKVKGYNDHRIIMAMATAAAGSTESIFIDDIAAAAVTFPTFFKLYESIRRI